MTNRRSKRVTQADVARHAKVSQAMVSYVVNNNTTISIPDETRQRIFDSMSELGYVPNVTARRLRTNKTLTIAGIIPDITNPFYPSLERGIQEIADQHNYDLIIYNTDGLKEKEQKYLKSLLQGRVDGLISVFFHLSARDLFPLVEQDIYVVRLEATQKPTGHLPIDNIYLDNFAAARTAVKHLVEQGHINIGMLTSDTGPTRYRELGYRSTLEQHNLEIKPEWTQIAEYNEVGGYDAMGRLLAQTPYPSAVFAANDLMAMGAMMAIREAGLSIPNDIAVIGFDDIPSAKLVSPSLTTIAQHQRLMGQRAAELLFERLNGVVSNGGRNEQAPYELIVREST